MSGALSQSFNVIHELTGRQKPVYTKVQIQILDVQWLRGTKQDIEDFYDFAVDE